MIKTIMSGTPPKFPKHTPEVEHLPTDKTDCRDRPKNLPTWSTENIVGEQKKKKENIVVHLSLDPRDKIVFLFIYFFYKH